MILALGNEMLEAAGSFSVACSDSLPGQARAPAPTRVLGRFAKIQLHS